MYQPLPAKIAVLTGDLVGSTPAGDGVTSKAMENLRQSAEDVATWFTGPESRFTRYRGDGWQMIVTPAHLSVRAALYCTARLKAARLKMETRISIGIGTVENWGTGSLLSDAGGAAFTASGQGLDRMKRLQRLTISGDTIANLDAVIVQLLSVMAQRWTPEQAEAVAFDLDPDHKYTQAMIAGILGISPQAVNYRLNGANAYNLRMALGSWEDDAESRGLS